MTNGEKLEQIFPDGICPFSKSWLDCEYKEPLTKVNQDLTKNKSEIPTGSTTKNDLGVDKEQLKTMIRGLTKWYVKRDNTEVGEPNTAVGLLYDDVMFGIDRLPSVTPLEPRWIPVCERLPEDGQYVMVTFGDKIAVCLAQDNNGTLQEVTSLISKNATEIWLYPEPKWGDGYAAWMPLPEPYKAESEG
jgi:hypothetical protein